MRPLAILMLSALALLPVACERAAPARDQATPAAASASAMEFRGERPCADCDGIEAWLRLEQDGKLQRYRLIERYSSGTHEREFKDEGEWIAEGDLQMSMIGKPSLNTAARATVTATGRADH